MNSRKSSAPSGEGLLILAVLLVLYAAWHYWNGAAPNIRIAIIAGVLGIFDLLIFSIIRMRRKKVKRIKEAAANERWRLSSMSLKALTPIEFEQEITWVFGVNINWATTSTVGRAGDQGVDVEMRDSNGKLRGVVQCKFRSNPSDTVEPSAIRDMDSTRHRKNAEHAFVVTNARFSNQSLAMGKQYNIHLIDGQRFEQFRRKAYAKFYAQEGAVPLPDDNPLALFEGGFIPEPPALKQTPGTGQTIIKQRTANPSETVISSKSDGPANDVDRQLAERRERLKTKQ